MTRRHRKPWYRRVKWDNVSLALAVVAIAGVEIWTFTADPPAFDWNLLKPKHVVTYSYRVEEGDTLWDVASNMALPREDLREIVFNIQAQNKIKDPGAIQPGTVITITMERKK